MANRPWDKSQVAFQQAMQRVRKRAGLTQANLSQKLAKPQSYVSKYENGERRLDYLEVKKICACCNISVAEFDHLLGNPDWNEPSSPGGGG